MPLSEFNGPYDTYTMAEAHPEQLRLPRRIQEYDIINMVCRRPNESEFKPVSLLMIREKTNAHLIYPKAQLQWMPGKEFVQLPIKGEGLPSFRK